jgi:hypothetical protein
VSVHVSEKRERAPHKHERERETNSKLLSKAEDYRFVGSECGFLTLAANLGPSYSGTGVLTVGGFE